MIRGSVRLGLSLMVMLSVWTHGLPAQELIGVPPPRAWLVFVVPTIPYEPEHLDPLLPPYEPPPAPGTARHRLMQLMKQHGYACGTDNGWGCGNFTYEMYFFFGSCREFFGQRCDACQRRNPNVERANVAATNLGPR